MHEHMSLKSLRGVAGVLDDTVLVLWTIYAWRLLFMSCCRNSDKPHFSGDHGTGILLRYFGRLLFWFAAPSVAARLVAGIDTCDGVIVIDASSGRGVPPQLMVLIFLASMTVLYGIGRWIIRGLTSTPASAEPMGMAPAVALTISMTLSMLAQELITHPTEELLQDRNLLADSPTLANIAHSRMGAAIASDSSSGEASEGNSEDSFFSHRKERYDACYGEFDRALLLLRLIAVAAILIGAYRGYRNSRASANSVQQPIADTSVAESASRNEVASQTDAVAGGKSVDPPVAQAAVTPVKKPTRGRSASSSSRLPQSRSRKASKTRQ